MRAPAREELPDARWRPEPAWLRRARPEPDGFGAGVVVAGAGVVAAGAGVVAAGAGVVTAGAGVVTAAAAAVVVVELAVWLTALAVRLVWPGAFAELPWLAPLFPGPPGLPLLPLPLDGLAEVVVLWVVWATTGWATPFPFPFPCP